ncbi:MAG: tetratricopeptide repeat protein [Halobacteriovoraceae bacterium]|nr:tetratricopeptide repeat protein [Halobacteriovoraceae bacterium]
MNFNDIFFIGGYFERSMGVYTIEGPDAYSYLNRQTTQWVSDKPQLGSMQVLLNPDGRYCCRFYLHCTSQDKYTVLVGSEEISAFEERIERFHISEDFTLNKKNQSCFFVFGFKAINEIKKNYDQESKSIQARWDGHPFLIVFEKPKTLQEKPNYRGSLEKIHGITEQLEGRLFNETRFYELAFDPTKGCFPGQETVGKLGTRRGAAKYPVLLKNNDEISNNENGFWYEKSYFIPVLARRQDRVEGKKYNDRGKVKLFPLVPENDNCLAEEFYERALKKYQKIGEEQSSEDYLRAALSFDSQLSDAYEMLGVILSHKGKYQEAIDLMDELVKLEPDSVMAHTNLSLYYMKLGKIEEAEKEKELATFKRFEQLGRENDLEDEKKKQEEEKVRRKEMFQQVLEIDEDDLVANFGMAEILFEEENFKESEERLSKVLQLNPKHSVSYLLLAKVYLKTQEKSLALKLLTDGVIVAAENGDFQPANEMQNLINQLTL